MENNPVLFLCLVVAWVFIAAYNIIKGTIIITMGITKWGVRKIKGRGVENNVIR